MPNSYTIKLNVNVFFVKCSNLTKGHLTLFDSIAFSQIKADIALESWLFGFRPCSGQGQLTLPTYCI